ncbi:hypothetical protein [Clostridium sp. OS1-26]|uniref:hypothetical protein n=1 Tax=Clostridium sp. OS1-26 TaxID=3070681 RepID=UPI0027E03D0D|nr:hypothetical protein [Clostridium sp. OS1-26]WML33495.1 hypothetical protein RCG18_19390 [Clostridium sp. OS1-26]
MIKILILGASGFLGGKVYLKFNRKMARKLGLDENLVIEDTISIENAIANGIPLDTSMNTSKCKMIFKTSFRNV